MSKVNATATSSDPQPTRIRVVLGGATYEVGFDQAGRAVFVHMLNWRPEAVRQTYQTKTLWQVEYGTPSLVVDAAIKLAKKRLAQTAAQ